ncbi:MAG: NmrA family transcriptional regulator [Acidimicrobiia bacterium]
MNDSHQNRTKPILVLGATDKTGRRVVERLQTRGVPVRAVSRTTEISFDWTDQATWSPALRGARSAYVTFQPDLAVPGANEAIRAFSTLAVESGLEHLVLLSGRGEPEAEVCEQTVQEAGVDWTILRSSWFSQNWSESFLLEPVLAGEVVMPAGEIPEPFVDADDIADVAVAALTQEGHAGQLYELTGPRMMTFPEAVAEISRATGRQIRYHQVSPEQFSNGLADHGVPADFVWLLDYLFTTVLDGRNAHLADGVQRALGREPIDFADYVRATSGTETWKASD